jgi:4-hydroxythreonine-4-phosphate dehydrogenase
MPAALPRIVLTAGEPAGIGPDLCALLATRTHPATLVIVGDRLVLKDRAAQRGLAFSAPDYVPGMDVPISLLHMPVVVPVQAGKPDPGNATHVLSLLDRAVAGCSSGEFAAMVTAPVQKASIAAAGIAFTGHTEYLAQKTGTPRVVMMLAGGGLRVVLATTHLPLAAVPSAITRAGLLEGLAITDRALRRDFGIAQPRLLVAGLNPHAGESGHLGREEIDVISPAIALARAQGIDASGPMPADTLFTESATAGADAVVAMYHDQGLPVLKRAAFGRAVNVTLGLPIIRTSVDHGTALDRAGSGPVDEGSLAEALALAIELAQRRR